jgi:quercetin dioxygenase-like cupin family protein
MRSLTSSGRKRFRRAAAAAPRRCSGHEKALRQTVIALTAGVELSEHENPGEATVLVLSGRVELRSHEVSREGRNGDLLVVPDERHTLHAVVDSAVLLTVVKT